MFIQFYVFFRLEVERKARLEAEVKIKAMEEKIVFDGKAFGEVGQYTAILFRFTSTFEPALETSCM